MYLQTSRLQYNLQGVVSFQTAVSLILVKFYLLSHSLTIMLIKL